MFTYGLLYMVARGLQGVYSMSMNLPKPYLSYSALSLWRKDREGYRRRYYLGEKPPETIHTIYGSEIHKLIEDGKLDVEDHPREKYQSEVKLEVEIGGIPVLGMMDLFNPKTKAVSDIKTGIPRLDGSPRWTQLEVERLDQLPFYQMMIRAKYGKVQKTAKLIWLECEWHTVTDTHEFDGHKLTKERRDLRLNGKQHVFKRVIQPWELDRQEEMLIRDAREIQKDYYYFTLKHGA